jgi:5'-nucleotidase/UDP-sugar diphosphatase
MSRFFPIFRRHIVFLFVSAFAASGVHAQPKTITILHTNDMHAAFLPHEAAWVRTDPKPLVGGFEELWWIVDSLRTAKNETILLDAGDVMTGTPISDIAYKGADGGGLFEMMNGIGYDAWTIGNHDLDISQNNLRKLTEIATFPTLSANLVDSAGRTSLGNKEYIIVNKGGVRVGIIGIMSSDLFRLTNTNNLTGLNVLPPADVVQKIIDKIDPQTDLIIALTHQGVDEDSILAVRTRGLDIIVGGHSHTRLTTPKYINNVIICQAGTRVENLGELEVTVENGNVTSYTGKLIQLWPRQRGEKSGISDLIDRFRSQIDREYGEVVGTLTEDWKRGRGETPIGNFVADAMREAVGADFAVTNSTGIRKDLVAGPVKKLDIFEVSPFRNVVTTVVMTGKEVKALALWNARLIAENRGSVQTSGLFCTWKRGPHGVELVSLKVGDKDVEDAKTYVCATSDYIVNQGDKYLGIVPTNSAFANTTMFQAIVAKAAREKTLVSDRKPRFEETQ